MPHIITLQFADLNQNYDFVLAKQCISRQDGIIVIIVLIFYDLLDLLLSEAKV